MNRRNSKEMHIRVLLGQGENRREARRVQLDNTDEGYMPPGQHPRDVHIAKPENALEEVLAPMIEHRRLNTACMHVQRLFDGLGLEPRLHRESRDFAILHFTRMPAVIHTIAINS